MTSAPSPTAALLIIGNEILSGRTQDANLAWLARQCALRGIPLREVRVVRDEEEAVVEAVRALSDKYTYVFTTGGIGPTHDDITADCMARAFGAPLEVHPEARERLAGYYKLKPEEITDARLRMARIPRGAALVGNPVSGAPGFRIKNVYVMAGVPRIMQAMFESFAHELHSGPPILSRTVTAPLRESQIAAGLEAIQNEFPDIEIGSYPQMKDRMPEVSLVLSGTDAARLELAESKVKALVGQL